PLTPCFWGFFLPVDDGTKWVHYSDVRHMCATPLNSTGDTSMSKIKPNCGPASVSHLLGEAVAVTMDRFRDQFKRYAGPRWQGYSYVKDCVSLLKRHGKVEEVWCEIGSVGKFPGHNMDPSMVITRISFEPDGIGTLKQYFVEASNVNLAEELVSMIVAQRAYEINSRAISASDEMLQRLGQL
ncbi:MAG: hypothetical protein EBT14_07525, partial [Betaproteobacteria bacterium]|nr:hypothetical protein [Betaproteobacteria bacterium]